MSARGSNPLNYTFCVLILLFLYSADDVRYPISKNLNPLQNNGFRHRITLPDLDNDNHLFRSGRVVHSGTPEGTRIMDGVEYVVKYSLSSPCKYKALSYFRKCGKMLFRPLKGKHKGKNEQEPARPGDSRFAIQS